MGDFLEFAGLGDVEDVVTTVVQVVAAATDGAQRGAAGGYAGQGDGFFGLEAGGGCFLGHVQFLMFNAEIEKKRTLRWAGSVFLRIP